MCSFFVSVLPFVHVLQGQAHAAMPSQSALPFAWPSLRAAASGPVEGRQAEAALIGYHQQSQVSLEPMALKHTAAAELAHSSCD